MTTANEESLGLNPLSDDSDGDGLTDQYEIDVALTNPLLADTDGDGSNDSHEISAGTDALNRASRFYLSGFGRNANGKATLTWPSAAGKSFRVARSFDLGQTQYLTIGSGLPATPPQNSFTDTLPVGDDRMFYWVAVEPLLNAVGGDSDIDGLSNAQEAALGTNPLLYDSDGDGLGDGAEANVHGSNPLRADTDGDGSNDWPELVAGTGVTKPASVLAIKSIARNADGSVTLQWSGVIGKTYRVLRSTTPDTGGYQTMVIGRPGVAPITSYTDNSAMFTGGTALFYKVAVE